MASKRKTMKDYSEVNPQAVEEEPEAEVTTEEPTIPEAPTEGDSEAPEAPTESTAIDVETQRIEAELEAANKEYETALQALNDNPRDLAARGAFAEAMAKVQELEGKLSTRKVDMVRFELTNAVARVFEDAGSGYEGSYNVVLDASTIARAKTLCAMDAIRESYGLGYPVSFTRQEGDTISRVVKVGQEVGSQPKAKASKGSGGNGSKGGKSWSNGSETLSSKALYERFCYSIGALGLWGTIRAGAYGNWVRKAIDEGQLPGWSAT